MHNFNKSVDSDFDKGNFFMIVFALSNEFSIKVLNLNIGSIEKDILLSISIKFTNASFMPMPLK